MLGPTKVKICGITRPEDARLAGELGADAVGLNCHRLSPRCVDLQKARELVDVVAPAVETVGVFVDVSADEIRDVLNETGISSVQLHGSEPPSLIAELAPRRVLKAFRWKNEASASEIDAYLAECQLQGALPTSLLIDAHRPGVPGGTGETWNWGQLNDGSISLPLVLAGGLSAENVGRAIQTLRPYGVDVASGVEAEPGQKDPDKMRAFFEAVRIADEESEQ